MNRYRLLIGLLSLPITFYTLWLAIRNKDFRYFTQRLGLDSFDFKADNSNVLWVHAASVGEVNAAIPLINKFKENNSIVLTTNTPSSAIRAKNIFAESITHFYCPVDWRWAVNKFIKKTQPKYLFIIETELWPSLFFVCKKYNIPISILNGRISEKTLHAANWIKKRYAECLQITNIILTRSTEDSQRFIMLGADSSIVKTIGNIKYYPNFSSNKVNAFSSIKPYVLAASTRDNEERLIISAWLESQKEIKHKHLLIIVPRHPHRLTTIIEQLVPFNLNIAIRSRNEDIEDETDIYIADTFGELMSFIKGAKFVFMGGSFVNKGGQNILEVAHAQKTVVFGADMSNFKDEAKLFVKQQAGIQVENINELPETIIRLLTQPEKIEHYQKRANKLMRQQKNVLDDYIKEIQKLYPQLKI